MSDSTETAQILQALEWALGDGDDPGAWPDGVAMPDGPKVWVDGLRAPTELAAVALYNRGGDGWLPASVRMHRRTYAARRVLTSIRKGSTDV